MTTAEKLYTKLQTLPEPILQEVLDFTEFLSKRESPLEKSNNPFLYDLIGGLETSTTFSGDPLAIQKQMRNEWH